MEQIIYNNDNGESPFFNNPDRIAYFILELLKMKEIILVKKAIEICGIFEKDYDGFPPMLKYLYKYYHTKKEFAKIKKYMMMEFSKLTEYINDIYEHPWFQ